MSTKCPRLFEDTNLSYAWGRAFQNVMEEPGRDLSPLVISIEGFNNGLATEDPVIRNALDVALREHGKFPCDVSAMVIFPFKVWNQRGRPHIRAFSEFYMQEYLPRLRARNPLNRKGTYFERMVAFQGVRGKGGKILNETRNQLEHIIDLWYRAAEAARRPRQSALQVACFDPIRDHNGSPRSVFPCLQQVSFSYDDSGGMSVNAYYPAQYIFDRAYGNYLGLCHLGFFMASELRLNLIRLNCFIGRPQLGGCTKSAMLKLKEVVRAQLSERPMVENQGR